jgi:glycosyltransferase involved in cell wall biosynthesis
MPKETPLVSVVIAAYRQLAYLREAVASALSQTFSDFEVIITDDSGSDEIKAYAEGVRDPRIRYQANSTPLGIARNHLAGYRMARGKYIANLNHDDKWSPTFLSRLVSRLEDNPSVNAALSEFWIINADGSVNSQRTDREVACAGRGGLPEGIYSGDKFLVRGTMPMAMAAVFRKAILSGGPVPRSVGGAYDAWLSFLAARESGTVAYFPERLTYYRTHVQSATDTRGFQNLRECLFVLRRVLKTRTSEVDRRILSKNVGIMAGNFAAFLVRQRKPKRALPYIKLSVSLLRSPKNLVALAYKLLTSALNRNPVVCLHLAAVGCFAFGAAGFGWGAEIFPVAVKDWMSRDEAERRNAGEVLQYQGKRSVSSARFALTDLPPLPLVTFS